MYKLYIDTTKRNENILKLLKVDNSRIDKSSDDNEKILEIESVVGDFDVITEISKLLKKHNLGIKDIDETLVDKGPGSFTGLKIGVTIANVLNWATGKKKIDELDMPDYGREPNISERKK